MKECIKEEQPARPTSTEPLKGVARVLGVPDLDLEEGGQITPQRKDCHRGEEQFTKMYEMD